MKTIITKVILTDTAHCTNICIYYASGRTYEYHNEMPDRIAKWCKEHTLAVYKLNQHGRLYMKWEA